MKVAILIPRRSGGGAEDVARKWWLALESHGHEVEFVLTHDISPTDSEGAGNISLESKSGFLSKAAMFRKIVGANKYEAVISLMPYCNLLALIACAGLSEKSKPNVVISEHTIHGELNQFDTIGHQIQWQMAKSLYRHASAVIAVSHPVAAELSSSCHVPSARLWVIPNPAAEGIDQRISRPAVAGIELDSQGTLAIVVPARLIRQKRLDVAVRAARLVAQQTKRRVRIEFFGEGPEERRLGELAALEEIPCYFRGWVDRWYDHIPEDGIVLLPSGTEGFGNVLLEAAARSVPSVVSSKALGVADACIPGVTAQLVLGDTPADYARGIISASEMVLPDLSTWIERFTNQSAASALSLVLSRSTLCKMREEHLVADILDETMTATSNPSYKGIQP